MDNTQDFIFHSDFKYPPVVQAGTTEVPTQTYDTMVLTGGLDINDDFAVFRRRIIGNTNEPIVERDDTSYISPTGDLIYRPSFPPETVIWRTYAY